jgi:hypothetical protein
MEEKAKRMEEMFIHKEGFSRPGKFLEGPIV